MSMKTLENNVINVWGDQGRAWLNNLSSTIIELSVQWQLSDITPVDNLSYNYVAFAKQYNNTPVVLKISCDGSIIEDEYHALRHFNDARCIQVIDRATNYNALLLEQAIPGYSLKLNYLKDIEVTIRSYAGIVKMLATKPTPTTDHPHVEKWCQAIDRITDPRIGLEYINKAKELRDYLLSSVNNEHLCHGDLHLDNIIQHEDKWLCIDPKGILGETAFEAAAFDLLDESDWHEPETMPDTFNQRLSLLASSIEVSEERLRAWVFLRTIISAQWFIEDNGNPNEKLRLASVLYPSLSI